MKAAVVEDNLVVLLGIFANELIRLIPITSAVGPQDVLELIQ